MCDEGRIFGLEDGESPSRAIKSDFISSMKLTKEIFGNLAFRKVFNLKERRQPINKALFEVWSVELAKLSEHERNKLCMRGKELFRDFIDLMNEDEEFMDSITWSTGSRSRVNYRYSKIEAIINKVLV